MRNRSASTGRAPLTQYAVRITPYASRITRYALLPAFTSPARPVTHFPMELPHTAGCLVCGRQNPHGLRLSLDVDESSGVVRVDFTPRPEHIGFEGIVHGGV